MKQESLAEYLIRYSNQDISPMHMPGHKRHMPKSIRRLFENIEALDVTELPATDDLHDAHGILKECMDYASRVYGSRQTFFLVNGSTCGIMAAIHASCRMLGGASDTDCKPCEKSTTSFMPSKVGDSSLAISSCDEGRVHVVSFDDMHISVRRAVEMAGAKLIELTRTQDASADPLMIEVALQTDAMAKVVLVTSPTYDGVISDIKTISNIVHKNGGILIVDEAHGAHLKFLEKAWDRHGVIDGLDRYESAISLGADIVINSLHKTLPAFTQTALLHVCTWAVDIDILRESLAIYETSSPSYILMASIDSCIRYMEGEGTDRLYKFYKYLSKFYDKINDTKHIRLIKPSESLHHYDISKILISSETCTGYELARILREQYGIELEMACDGYALALTSLCDRKKDIKRLASALIDMDDVLGESILAYDEPVAKGLSKKRSSILASTSPRRVAEDKKPSSKHNLDRQTGDIQTRLSDLEKRLGQVTNRYVLKYPPTRMIMKPGDIFTQEVISQISEELKKGAHITGI